jgi:PAS domain S-box-containing protein
MNPRACEMFGYSLDQAIDKPIAMLMDEEGRRVFHEQMLQRRQGGRQRYEMTWTRRDGTTFHTQISPRPLFDAQNRFIGSIGVITDITERKQAEVALREASERNRVLFEGAPHGILVADPQTRTFQYANPAICKMLGYAAGELVRLGVQDIHPAAELPRVLRDFEAQSRAEGVVAQDILCLRKDGTVFHADIAGTPLALNGRPMLVGFFSDVTARKQAEEEIRRLNATLEQRVQERTTELAAVNARLCESLERFRQVTESITEVFWMTDRDRAQVLYISPGYERIWGRTCASLYQSPCTWFEAIHPEDRDRVQQAARTRQIRGEYCERYRILRPDGALRWILDRAFPVRDATGAVHRIAGIAEDITAQKRAADCYAAFARLGLDLNATTTPVEAARLIANTAADLFGWDACYVQLDVPGRDEVEWVLAIDAREGRRVDVAPATLATHCTPVMTHIREGGARLINRGEADSTAVGSVPLEPFGDTSRLLKAIMCVPIRHGAAVVGLLSIQSCNARAYRQDDLGLLQILADHCGGALERLQAAERARRLEKEIVEISAREQRRIGFELHDGLGQTLGGIAFRAAALAERLRAQRSAQAEDAEALAGFLNKAVAETRTLAQGLAAMEVDAAGLGQALQRVCVDNALHPGVACVFARAGREIRLQFAAELHLFRIAQESIHNALRHGTPTRVEVTLDFDHPRLCLLVKDNGRGFDPHGEAGRGIGLGIMRYRADALGAVLSVHSRLGQGTEVRCELPDCRPWER